MHELGHNLGLYHGGGDNCNYKPNYNSVMNYLYQFPGIDTNCDPLPDGLLSYSTGSRITLLESPLDENLGTCGAPSWDWNDWAHVIFTTIAEADGAPVAPPEIIECNNPAPGFGPTP